MPSEPGASVRFAAAWHRFSRGEPKKGGPKSKSSANSDSIAGPGPSVRDFCVDRIYVLYYDTMKRLFLSPLCCLLLLCLGCGTRGASRSLFHMDTFLKLDCYGTNAEAALDACQAEIVRLEALFSATLEGSDISRLNRASGEAVEVDADTAQLLRRAREMSILTGGAFHPAVGSLVDAWGFLTDAPAVPAEAKLQKLLPLPSAQAIQIDGTRITLDSAARLDLGGIAKGYCSERLCNIAREYGIESALFTLGGNVEAVGSRPDGSPWRVGVRDPEDAEGIVGVIELVDRAAVTSGGYQRYFEQDGTRYHHILDPETGYPANSGLRSVTVIAESGTDADALSTAFFVLGMDAAVALMRSAALDCDAVFILSDGSIRCTEGARFTANAGKDCRTISNS